MLITIVNRKKLKKFFAVVLILTLFCGLIYYFNNVTYPLIVELAEVQAENSVNNIVNGAAKRITALTAFQEDFYTYEKNNEGEVVLVKANTASINRLMALARIEIQNALNELEDMSVSLRLGAFTGSSMLAKSGPDVKIHIIPVGNAVAKWESYYYNKGINQTIHRLLLRVAAKVTLVIPVRATDCIILTDIVIAEDIIIGRVPDTYIGDMDSEDINDNIFDLLQVA